MKLWSAEQSAKGLSVFLLMCGAIISGTRAFFAGGVPYEDGVDPALAALSVNGVSYLAQSAGMALYLRTRGRKGLVCLGSFCLLSLGLAVASVVLSDGKFGTRTLLLVLVPLVSAIGSYALAARRLERGDDSPLLPGSKSLAKMTWKEVLLVYLCAAALTALLYAVFGGDHPLFRSHDGWSAEAGREEAGVEVAPPRPADIDVDWGGGQGS